jgi:hypothetical protein
MAASEYMIVLSIALHATANFYSVASTTNLLVVNGVKETLGASQKRNFLECSS